MQTFSQLEIYRNGWTLNEIVNPNKEAGETLPKLKAVYLCYIVQYGRKPVYAVHSLGSSRIGKFEGTKEDLFRLFKNLTPQKVSLTSKITGFFDVVTPELRDKELSEQLDLEYKVVKPAVNNTSENMATVIL